MIFVRAMRVGDPQYGRGAVGGGGGGGLDPIMSYLILGHGRNVRIGKTQVFVLNDFLE